MNFFNESLNVVVTAGASGIGRKIVEAYWEQKCNIIVCDIDENLIDNFKLDLPDIPIFKTDVSDYNQVKEFFEEVLRSMEYVDVLVNSAGIAGPTSLMEDVEPEEWNNTINVNVNGMFYCLKEAIPMIRKSDKGSIINIASNAAFFGFPYRSPYTAAKWATIGMTKTLAMELGKEGIRVNAICPGSVTGNRIDKVIAADAKEQGRTEEEIKKLYVKQVSMKTFIDPEDVANLCLFLTSDYGKFISGQAIGLDGHTEGLSTNI
jgi:NAD(P)-dependent dehydrogenase (short-subunit alcohol dehydrogenase family)